MRKIILLYIILVHLPIFSQEIKTVNIDWIEKTEFSFGDFAVNIPQFNIENLSYNNTEKSIQYKSKFKSSFLINENAITISNITYQNIIESDLKDLDKNNIPNNVSISIKNIISRDEIYGLLCFSPIVKNGNGFQKVVSLTFSFGPETNKTTTDVKLKNSNTISNSVLSSGTWKRFYVEKSGVYKITKAFLNQLGINTNGINPANIKIYGNGGRMIPLSNNQLYPNDIEENSIQVVGESDGNFDENDYILFYAEGMDNWSPENQTHLNLYSDKSYYYITTDGAQGKRITAFTEPNLSSTLVLTNFDDYQFHEVDLTNIGRLGRVWFGEAFNIDNEQEFNFNFPNIETTIPSQIKIRFGGSSFVSTSFDTTVNSTALAQSTLSIVPTNSDVLASENNLNTSIVSSPNFNVKIKFNNGGVPTSKGYLDYIIIKSKSKLLGYGKQYKFQYDLASTSTGIAEYQFNNSISIKQVWDITDIYNVSTVLNNNQSNFSFKSTLGASRKYIAVDENDYYTPLKESNTSVSNQDIKGTIFLNKQGNFEDIDYLIITPSFLNSQAEKLANFHRTYSNLNVKVINLESIYQEFCSGKQDIGAIRNLVKYVYQNASSPTKKLKYLNLFGDASFDFKNRIKNIANTNVVPIFHSSNYSTTGTLSFASDDYFGLMDSNEGDPETSPFNNGIDVAVGRMLVSSVQQAEEMVNKVIEYHDIKAYGNWRNNYVSIADDSDKPSDVSLQSRQNDLTDIIHLQKPFINFKKILLDSYEQQTTAGGSRYPQAKADIQNAFEKGTLVMNYLGHGGEEGLTGERIWDKFDGYDFHNQYRYPLFITITCDFSRFDNPYRPTAGEYTYWNPKGGAISMITTIRTIGQGGAELFNENLASKLFSYGSNSYNSIAESLRLAKVAANDNYTTQVIFYLGDPALKLAIPDQKIILTKVNDIPISQPFPDLKALDFIKLSGEIQDEFGNFTSNYNGELFVNIFDKNIIKTTYNNDGNSPPINFTNLGETIFRGNASVTNGKFEFEFVVPKDIRIPIGNGRISFYSKRNQLLLDKTGYNTDIKIGGINTNAVADVTAPKVRLYMNDETFINGNITNESPFFLAFLEDEHGINTASGIGHDIVAILDGNESNPYVLNDYYETELNDYTKGKIRFPFRNLSIGLHTIVFKAWDVYNNYISAEIQFIVVNNETVSLSNVLNYPNPFVNYTQFWFNHNKPYETLEVQVQIFTITGKIVKTINQSITTEGFLSNQISWDGKDDFGEKIGKGVYVYKLTVKSTLTGEKAEKIEKLVIL